jgi:tetratricopeptide (TPR) repeat protein
MSACSTQSNQRDTLRDIDISDKKTMQANIFVKPKTDEEIKQAYINYIKNSTKNDSSRLTAIKRLAELEIELINKTLKENDAIDNNREEDSRYETSLNKTIELLSTSLRDYPQAKGNDRILYQLADTYNQKGEYLQAINLLKNLVSKYPKSPFYVETQFRLAEHAFTMGDYISAEDAYTEVLASPLNDIFYEKSLFKRGWSRYKQQLYLDAVDDYLDAVEHHNFAAYEKLEKNEKDQFEEYFRAVGLAFSNLGGTNALLDYFSEESDFKYLYQTYATISDIYLKQERYSDAANTINQFIRYNPNSVYIPYSQLKIIAIWQKSQFISKLYGAIESFYVTYNPSSQYWKTTNVSSDIGTAVEKSLRGYVVLVSEYFHNQYQDSKKSSDFNKANTWYKRYLDNYSSYARQDNIFYQYAELLDLAKRDNQSIVYFELAAYDGDIILDKKSAYATIVISDRLHSNNKGESKTYWLNKHLNYALLYSQLYPTDKRSGKIIFHASSMAFSNNQFSKAIALAELLPSNASEKTLYNTNIIRAQGYFKLGRFHEAETIYTDILSASNFTRFDREKLNDNLALTIYKQAEQASKANDIEGASRHFMRIIKVAPRSEIAATGVYDAIALSVSQSLWQQSIQYIKVFQGAFPQHKLSNDVTKKLSVAYLNSNQSIKAAQEFERISSSDSDDNVKKAALLQAAELYESKNELASAIRSYREYANSFRAPYPQYMEVMYTLSALYTKTNDSQKAYFWSNKIRKADKNITTSTKTERTKYIVSISTLKLAKEKHSVFNRRKLVEPLRENLRKKKQDMQDAVLLYGQASVYGISEISTESTYAIGSIYRDFSIALLESERPKSLNGEELEQYDILLEDQAFPFEEKAIEFYETNLSRTKNGIYDEWIKKSYLTLTELFPVRYKRKGKIETYISEIK